MAHSGISRIPGAASSWMCVSVCPMIAIKITLTGPDSLDLMERSFPSEYT